MPLVAIAVHCNICYCSVTYHHGDTGCCWAPQHRTHSTTSSGACFLLLGLQDAAGHHSSALFVQWVPYSLTGTTWEAEEENYVKHLLNIVDTFAPGAQTTSSATTANLVSAEVRGRMHTCSRASNVLTVGRKMQT